MVNKMRNLRRIWWRLQGLVDLKIMFYGVKTWLNVVLRQRYNSSTFGAKLEVEIFFSKKKSKIYGSNFVALKNVAPRSMGSL